MASCKDGHHPACVEERQPDGKEVSFYRVHPKRNAWEVFSDTISVQEPQGRWIRKKFSAGLSGFRWGFGSVCNTPPD